MRTTIVLDDGLFREARKRAVETGRTMSDLVAEALRGLLRSPGPMPRERFLMPTFGGRRRVRHEPADFAAALEHDDKSQRGRPG